MISGIVKNGHATVNIIFRLPNQPNFTIEFVINTGFTEFLSLPPAAVTLLSFPFVYDIYANLADNSNVILPVHQATIIWNGKEQVVNVLATERLPLLGTALLDGYELVIQFIEGGLVTIDEL
ncbi:MAG: clan AA aspartic protease [Nostoc sp. DedSLP03]|uniref:clan AA aspartic protease n=1 Tax=Nostoc sp. DedSLP03 TaxID=3075400 RepID=UPI002AD57309|nr:clan AA aspartic protease [Nostoc sp. DedSLP03]MDZ7966929.1 clan AA aspartic protease [Nostoc sp. DedSLP03]